MKRRRLLLSLGGLALLSGCQSDSENSSPSPSESTSAIPTTDPPRGSDSPTPSPTEGVTPTLAPSPTATPIGYRPAFVAAVEGYGADVSSIDVDGSDVHLEYVTTKSDYNDLGAEIGAIAGSFFKQVERGWDVDRLLSTILDGDGTPLATWHAEVAWLAEFRNGEISAEQLSFRILDTLEPVE